MPVHKPSKRKKPEPHVCKITLEDLDEAVDQAYDKGVADEKAKQVHDRVLTIKDCLDVVEARRSELKKNRPLIFNWNTDARIAETKAIEGEMIKLLNERRGPRPEKS